MALKRRPIVAQALGIGYGTTTIPADSGGTLVGDLIGIHTFLGNTFLRAENQPGGSPYEQVTNALLAVSALGGGTVYAGAEGTTKTFDATVVIPASCTLILGAGTWTSGVAGRGITITPSIYDSGRLMGEGNQSVFNYTGSGYAVECSGTGEAATNFVVADLSITGTIAGSGGIHLKAINHGQIRNAQVSGFTKDVAIGLGAPAIFNEGANTIHILNCVLRDNAYGIWNVGAIVSSVNYSANAVIVHGGEIIANTRWGVWECGTLSATVGANSGNAYIGVVFENNGTTGATLTGNIFFQQAYGCKVIGSYLEYSAVFPTNNITIGDAQFAPQGNMIIGNIFLSPGATSTIENANGTNLVVEANQESAAVTNFFHNSTDARSPRVLWNSAAAATNYFGGSDTGVDALVFPVPTTSTLLNSFKTSADGLAFHTISGFNATAGLQIRNNGVAANALTVQDTAGASVLGVTDTTLETVAGVQIKAGGDLHFWVSDGQHIKTFSANNDICGQSTLSGGVKAITYATAYGAIPIVQLTSLSANHVWLSASTTTGFTASGTGSDVFNYSVIGNPD